MSIVSQLASALGRRDEVPNQELAAKIAAKNQEDAVRELVELLGHKSKDIQHDCIKVLYEIGDIKPTMISKYTGTFMALLKSKNNRMQWGAMCALDAIASADQEKIYKELVALVAAMDAGSVITKDRGMSILTKLCISKKHYADTFPLVLEQLSNSAVNQLPMYAEMVFPAVQPADKAKLARTLSSRLDDLEKESRRKRVEKVIQKLSK